MRYFKIAQLAVVFGALALPACSGGDLGAQSASAGSGGSSVVPQTVEMRQPASLRGFVKTPEPSPAASTVQTQSLRGFWATCVDCSIVKPAPSATPTPAPTSSPAATVKTSSVRGLIGQTFPSPKPDR